MAMEGPAERQPSPVDPDVHARRLAGEALAAGEPTGWFEPLYAAAEAGQAVVPWDRRIPHQLLVAWADATRLEGAGRRAVVVGCGLGEDAEPDDGPPWSLTRAEIDALTATGLRPVGIEELRDSGPPPTHRWRAEFCRV